MDAEGRLLIAARGLTTGRHLVARLRPDGLPDATFGSGGVATIPAEASYMSLSEDGRIALAWPSQAGADVTMLDANGTPVPGFGVAGVAHVAGTGHVRTVKALAVLGPTIYVALAIDPGWLEPHQVTATALDSSGAPDRAFGPVRPEVERHEARPSEQDDSGRGAAGRIRPHCAVQDRERTIPGEVLILAPVGHEPDIGPPTVTDAGPNEPAPQPNEGWPVAWSTRCHSSPFGSSRRRPSVTTRIGTWVKCWFQ